MSGVHRGNLGRKTSPCRSQLKVCTRLVGADIQLMPVAAVGQEWLVNDVEISQTSSSGRGIGLKTPLHDGVLTQLLW